MRGHVVVCGLGHLGVRVVGLLRRLGAEVVVVALDSRSEWIAAVKEAGARLVVGDARDEAVLASAGLDEASALLAVTDRDVVNVEVALDARARRADLPIVLRLFDRALADGLERALALRGAFALSSVAAPAFAAAALGARVSGTFTGAGGAFVVGRLEPGDESSEALERRLGLAVVDDARPRGGTRATVVATRAAWDAATGESRPRASAPRRRPALLVEMWRSTRPALRKLAVGLAAAIALSAVVFRVGLGLAPVDAVYFLLATVTTTGYGDINLLHAPAALKLYGCLVMVLGSAAMATLTSMLTEFLVTSRLAELIGRRRAPREGHVVVAGLGNLGFRVVEELRRHGVPFVAVERDADAPFARSLGADAPVVTGDARFAESLERAGAAGATAVIAATGDDAANLGIALAARRVNPEVRTVVRLFDPDFAEKARAGLPLDAALSASRMAAPLFAAAALDEGVKAAFEADGVLLVVREVAAERAAAEPGSRVLARSEGKVLLVSERELSAPPGPSGATPRA